MRLLALLYLPTFTAAHTDIILIKVLKTLDVEEWSIALPGVTEVAPPEQKRGYDQGGMAPLAISLGVGRKCLRFFSLNSIDLAG